MRKVTMILHGVFIALLLLQFGVIMYIDKVFGDVDVPIHFSLEGTVDEYGNISEYYLLVVLNIVVYLIMLLGAKFVRKTNAQQFEVFKNEEEKQLAEKKIKVFIQILAVNISVFVTLLLGNVLYNVRTGNDFSLGVPSIIIFILLSIVIIVLGFIWIFGAKRESV